MYVIVYYCVQIKYIVSAECYSEVKYKGKLLNLSFHCFLTFQLYKNNDFATLRLFILFTAFEYGAESFVISNYSNINLVLVLYLYTSSNLWSGSNYSSFLQVKFSENFNNIVNVQTV